MTSDIQVVSYRELAEPLRVAFRSFLDKESREDEPAAVNLVGLEELIHERYPHFYVLLHEGAIIGCGGGYELSSRVWVLGTRTWVTKAFRSRKIVRDLLLTTLKADAIACDAKILALTFNGYNKNLIELFSRKSRVDYTPDMLFYSNLNVVEYSLNIQNTEQWVIYERLDDTFVFNWRALKF